MEAKSIRLTDEDISILKSLIDIDMHSLELKLSLIEHEIAYRFEDSDEYKRKVKELGKAQADKIVSETVRKSVRQDERYHLGRILDAIHRISPLLTHYTKSTIEDIKENEGLLETFDSLHQDINFWSRLQAIVFNITNTDDRLKVESTAKLYAKGNVVSENIIKLFKH